MARTLGFAFVFSVVLGLVGCGSSEEVTSLTAEQRFEHAKALFDDEDYVEAISEFTVVTLQFPGSAFADDAQFYLGECRFCRGEYLLAAFEYQTLRRNMPASPLVPEAQYKLGLSYYQLSPKSPLDQQYTKKAIEELQAFVEYYPANEHVPDAESKIKELNTRLAKKQFETAQLYATMEYYKASLFCYDDVIERYHDTEYAPLALLGKAEVFMSRRKYKDAYAEITRFLERYPNSILRSRADKLKAAIEEQMLNEPERSQSVSGKDSGAGEGSLSSTRPPL
ncbi:MAG TPA: outer membrane protein assembly factor BamD [Bacteroidota bacterium]|nr:outer membrane protein assembly factor BamD [Bacteroidota bacterium]